MFSMILNEAIQECSRLEKQLSELSGQIVELKCVIRELQDLSCMEESIAGLRHQHSEMDVHHIILRQMLLALNEIILDYLSCENRICDNGEQNVNSYSRREIKVGRFIEYIK